MSMFLYHSTIAKANLAISGSIVGKFSGGNEDELIAVQGATSLQLLRLSSAKLSAGANKLQQVNQTDAFGTIRSLTKLVAPTKDYIALGSDSGKLVVVEYNPQRNSFEKLHEEVVGKAGSLRTVAGQFVASDPHGRALFVGAIEKQLLAFHFTSDAGGKSRLSSTPAEVQRSHTVIYDLVGLNVPISKPPAFATIELDYSLADQDPTGHALANAPKKVVFYDFDFTNNSVVAKWSEAVDPSAHKLVPLPDVPGGVLVCCQDKIVYKSNNSAEVSTPVPRRAHVTFKANEGTLFCASALKRPAPNAWTVLVQSEFGDLFEIAFQSNRSNTVEAISAKIYDTIPPSTSLSFLRSNLLFASSEVGAHLLYKVTDKATPGATFKLPGQDASDGQNYFMPRPLAHLSVEEELPSMGPIFDIKSENAFKEERPQLFLLSGAGTRSSFRILKSGLGLVTGPEVPMQARPMNVWATKSTTADQADKHLFISFDNNTTMALAINGEAVSEDTTLQINNAVPSLHMALLGNDTILQISPVAIRRIVAKKSSEWKPAGGKKLTHGASNSKQVAVAVAGGEIYTLDDGAAEARKLSAGGKDVTALAIQPVSTSRPKAKLLAFADTDTRLKVISLETGDVFASHVIQDKIVSLAFIQMSVYGTEKLILAVGTASGYLIRVLVDPQSGVVEDSSRKLVGLAPVKLAVLKVQDSPALLVMSSKNWLVYSRQSHLFIHPLNPTALPPLEGATNFAQADNPEGFVGVAKQSVFITGIADAIGEPFHQFEMGLKHTPRSSAFHSTTGKLVIIETDHNAASGEEYEQISAQVSKYVTGSSFVAGDSMDVDGADHGAANGMADKTLRRLLPEDQFGAPRPGAGKWASLIRLLDPTTSTTLDIVELPSNEAALSLCTCAFNDHAGEVFVCVGTAVDLVLQPKRVAKAGSIRVYKINGARKFEFVCQKPTNDVPGALCALQGQLLGGNGKTLTVYDLGKRKQQLIRKCENRQIPNQVVSLSAIGDRAVVGDSQESIFYMQYSKLNNSLEVTCDDTMPRWIVSQAMLDQSTVAASDKFGNIFILRVPDQILTSMDDPAAAKLDALYKTSASFKLEVVASFFVGETATKLVKTPLAVNGPEVLLYTTVAGRIGALVPFTSKETVTFFTNLELQMRIENPPLSGRDHLAYRSYYFSANNVVDGNLCDQFLELPQDKQKKIATALELSITQVIKKIEEIRGFL